MDRDELKWRVTVRLTNIMSAMDFQVLLEFIHKSKKKSHFMIFE